MIEIFHKETGAVLSRLEVPALAGADLRYLALAGADLRGQDLSGAKLAFSDLTGADPVP